MKMPNTLGPLPLIQAHFAPLSRITAFIVKVVDDDRRNPCLERINEKGQRAKEKAEFPYHIRRPGVTAADLGYIPLL